MTRRGAPVSGLPACSHEFPPFDSRELPEVLSRLRCGRLELVAPGGQSFSFVGALPGPNARVYLNDWDIAADVLHSEDSGFAEAYLQDRWSTPDLSAVLTVAALNYGPLEQTMYSRWRGNPLNLLRRLLRPNSRGVARCNIHARYDLGTDFYRRWLDQTMTYSSALFDGDWSRSLEDAQAAKYERILRLVNPKAGERVLEVGCGWGGFAAYAARTRGCHVHGITVSRRQLGWAQERIRLAGLEHQVKLEFSDYRDVEGAFDHIVSIEMIETVGERFWPAYFATLAERLRPRGRIAVQAIVIADRLFEQYRRRTDFIRQYISPGSLLMSASVFTRHARNAGLEVRSQHAFGADYAETLKRWRQRFNQAWPEMQASGLDARFKRLWNLYLSYCEAGFRARATDVLQVEMTHE